MDCPKCNSKNTIVIGMDWLTADSTINDNECQDCGATFLGPVPKWYSEWHKRQWNNV